MADLVFEPLADDHERAGFSCGMPLLDRFIREQAGQYERRGLGRTFVAVPTGERRVVGYYTLAASSAEVTEFPEKTRKRLPKHKTPVVLLGRMAIDHSMQGRGFGSDLLVDSFRATERAALTVGVFAVVVDAINELAKQFYEHHGFIPFNQRPLSLFLPMPEVREAIKLLG
jgi:GNAT superfamily N-acetyltransferase